MSVDADELPADRRVLRIGRFRVVSEPWRHHEPRGVRDGPASKVSNLYLFGPLIASVIAMLVWFAMDDGVDTGFRVDGQVKRCVRSSRKQYPCVVRLNSGDVVSVYMPRHQPGANVRLMLVRRPVTGSLYYVPAN